MNHIGIFETESHNKYIYDGTTNTIIYGEDEVISVINEQEKLDRASIYEKANKNLKDNMDKWDLFKLKIGRVNNISSDSIMKSIAEYSKPQLILGVTENCNLRCKYCIFSGNYEDFRTHANNTMKLDTAIKSVDKFIDYVNKWTESSPEKQPIISFYGGEPLLNYNLIKEVVKYVNSKQFNTMYSMTTNGTLLNDEIIKFLVDNNFLISVSLDGDKEINDKNRVFPNNLGSFDIVFNNIKKIQNEIKNQNKEMLLPIATLTCYEDNTDMVKLNNFFCKELDTLGKMAGRASKIKDMDNPDKVNTPNESMNQIFNKYINHILNTDNNKNKNDQFFLERIFGTPMSAMYNRNIVTDGLLYSDIIGNACMPGSKIFVSTNGNFHPCEKISSNFPIGNCEVGLDEDKISKLLHKWSSAFQDNCSECPYKAICGLCYASCSEGDDFNFEKICKGRRKSIEKQLSILYSILELNPRALGNLTINRDILTNNFIKYASIFSDC